MKKVLAMLLLCIAATGISAEAYADIPKENSFRYENGVPIEVQPSEDELSMFSVEDKDGIKGIDVSTFQGEIDWEKVKADGVEFAIIRCGFGDDEEKYDDAQWVRNADECTRLGIPFGAYFMSYAASEKEVYSEISHALRLLDGYELAYPVFYDLEDEDTVGLCTNEFIGYMTELFCSALQDAGYDVGIYADLNWWNTKLTSDVFNNSTWHKWIAQWGSSCTYSGDYTMWQYTSSGSVDGISGNVDMDYWYAEDDVDYTYPNTYTNTGNPRNDIVGVAKTQVGYTELTESGGTPVIDSETPYYTKYGEKYGNPNGHWCAYFVLWCADQAGLPSTVLCQSSACGSCAKFISWFKDNDRWEDSSYTPSAGDIIFFDWENDGAANHVGIVEKVENGTIYTIEGNTGGVNGYAVMEQDRNSCIFGYGIPNYELMDKLNGRTNTRQTAYVLPDTSSSSVWYTAANDELQVLCSDGDYYLIMYPFNYTGQFVISYVPKSVVDLSGSVPDATQYYSINKKGTANKTAKIYHNTTGNSLVGANGADCTVRATLNSGDEITVLFAENEYYFIKTDTVSGYVLSEDIDYDKGSALTGDVNGDGIADAGDAGLVLRYDAGLVELASEQVNIGDVNGDGVTDAGDAGIILRKDAGLID